LTDRVVRLGLGLLVNIWMARYLGPDRFGLFNYAAAFVALFFPVVTLGLDSLVVRDLARDPSHKDEILGTVFVLRITGAIVSCVLAVGLILFLRPDDAQVHWLVGITSLGALFQTFDTIDLWFQSQLQSRFTVYAKNAAFLLLAATKLAMIKLHAPLTAFAWATSAELAVGAIGLMFFYRRHYRFSAWRSSFERVRELMKSGWPLVLSGIAVYMQAKIDQVLIGDLIGNAELGNYSVGLRLVEVLGFIPVVIQISVAPALARAKTRSEDEYYGLLLNLYRLMFVLFLITAAPFCLFSTRFVMLLFGHEYAAAAALLPYFSIRIFFTNFGVAKGLFITNNNLFRYSLVMSVVGAVLNIALNYLLIPRYASMGAITAMGISFLANTILIDLLYPETKRNFGVMIKAVFTFWRLHLLPEQKQ
jgi:O-antigen/teichoic acid export membrane protein